MKFVVRGHAGFSAAGTDIVCAAVSTLVINAVNSCEVFCGAHLNTCDDGSVLECHVPPSGESVQLLLRSMVYGLQQVADAYPKNVKIRYFN